MSVLEISRFENDRKTPAGTEERLRHCFEAVGIRFEEDWGVAYKERRRPHKRRSKSVPRPMR